MFAKAFSRKKSPPLTALCLRACGPSGMPAIMNTIATVDPTNELKRALILHMLILYSAGEFVGNTLHWETMKGVWQGSDQYLRNTNYDVITAETILWLAFVIGQLWRADGRKDRQLFCRIGFGTVSLSLNMGLETIRYETGVDYRARMVESRKLYLQAAKEGRLSDAFATVILRSVGLKSLQNEPSTLGVAPLEFTPIGFVVNTFYSNIPSAIYDTFKNILREYSDLFPSDDATLEVEGDDE